MQAKIQVHSTLQYFNHESVIFILYHSATTPGWCHRTLVIGAVLGSRWVWVSESRISSRLPLLLFPHRLLIAGGLRSILCRHRKRLCLKPSLLHSQLLSLQPHPVVRLPVNSSHIVLAISATGIVLVSYLAAVFRRVTKEFVAWTWLGWKDLLYVCWFCGTGDAFEGDDTVAVFVSEGGVEGICDYVFGW